MNEIVTLTRELCESNGFDLKDYGHDHYQIVGRHSIVNYYPDSKKCSAYSPILDMTVKKCTPEQAITMCLESDEIASERAPKDKSNRVQQGARKIKEGLEEFRSSTHGPTNPAGLQDFYSGDRPPWEQIDDTFFISRADELRHKAYSLEQQVILIRAEIREIQHAV